MKVLRSKSFLYEAFSITDKCLYTSKVPVLLKNILYEKIQFFYL